MKELNLDIIMSNIHEAIEELNEWESKISSNQKSIEVEFELSMRHAYHHLNMAWNARHAETDKYENMSDADFITWGRFPMGLDCLAMDDTEK